MKILIPLLCLAQAYHAAAATAAQWRNRIVFQVLTDRFARTDGDTSSTCNVADKVYCGGTWQGIIKKLDYISDMGFTAVCDFSSCGPNSCHASRCACIALAIEHTEA